MPTLILAAALMSQCPSGVCPAPVARLPVAVAAAPVYATPCKPVRRPLFGLFRRHR